MPPMGLFVLDLLGYLHLLKALYGEEYRTGEDYGQYYKEDKASLVVDIHIQREELRTVESLRYHRKKEGTESDAYTRSSKGCYKDLLEEDA